MINYLISVLFLIFSYSYVLASSKDLVLTKESFKDIENAGFAILNELPMRVKLGTCVIIKIAPASTMKGKVLRIQDLKFLDEK